MTTMNDRMAEVRKAAMSYLSRIGGLPNQRFFTPTEAFWSEIARLVPAGVQLVDAGCGRGDLIAEAKERGMSIHGIDVCARDGQDRRVERADATGYCWSESKWMLVCRPSHDGWVLDAARLARKNGAHVIYIGLPSNYNKDLGSVKSRCVGVVGVEGEKMYVIEPYAKKNGR